MTKGKFPNSNTQIPDKLILTGDAAYLNEHSLNFIKAALSNGPQSDKLILSRWRKLLLNYQDKLQTNHHKKPFKPV